MGSEIENLQGMFKELQDRMISNQAAIAELDKCLESKKEFRATYLFEMAKRMLLSIETKTNTNTEEIELYRDSCYLFIKLTHRTLNEGGIPK